MKYDVVGLGACGVDLKAEVSGFPVPGAKIVASKSHIYAGGVTANNISQCSRLGMKSAWLGALGDDDFAEFLIREFRRDKVATPKMIRLKGSSSQIFFAWSDKDGRTGMIGIPGSNREISPEIVKEEFSGIIKKAKHFHTEVAVIPLSVALTGAKIAKAAKAKILLDIDADPYYLIKKEKIGTLRDLNELIALTDVIKMTRTAFRALSRSNEINRASVNKILSIGPKIIAITDADKGCFIGDKSHLFEIPGIKVKVAETIGAGDAFMGGLSYAILHDLSLEDVGRFANACGAYKCTREGIRSQGALKDIKKLTKLKNRVGF